MTTLLRGALAAALITVCICNAPAAWGQALSFTVAPAFPAGILPTSLAAGDFNGDGKPDLAVTNQNGLSILINNGQGGFQLPVNYIVGTNPQHVAARDFNGDGKIDLAVVNQGSGTVSILLGNGNGTFQAAATYLAGSNPRWVVIADLNGDGKPDLAVADSGFATGSGVSVLLGNGNGTFQAATFVAAGSVALSVAVADFNGDGKPDLAVANSGSDNVSVMLGNGNGTFQAAVNLSLDLPGVSVTPTSVVAGDFNLDGKLDLAVATPNHKDIAVFLGLGNGGFQAPVHYGLDDPNFVNNNNKLAVVDLNGDGKPDLVLANLSSNHVTVLLGAGDGTFPSAKSYAGGAEPTCVAIADFNGDGHLDVAVSDNTNDGTVALLLGNGTGALHAAPLYRSGSIPGSLAVGDLNGDGKLDIVTASAFNPTAGGIGSGAAMLGNGDGTFQAPAIWSTSPATSIALGDFNGDGKLDLVETIPGPGNGNVSVLLGNGNGTFQAPVAFTAGTTPQAVAVADLNGDGKLDLVVSNHNSFNVSVLLGAGNGTFQAAVNYATSVSGTPDSVAVGDINGDGKPDLVVGNTGVNATSVSILLGAGNGTFQAPFAVPTGFHSPSPLVVVAADFNGDGKVDIAATDGSTLAVLIGNGNTTFQLPVTSLVSAGRTINGMVVVGDFNADGKLDLAISTRDGISVLLGNGDGTFQPAVTYTPFLGGAVAVGDFNGDHVPDLVAADSSQDSVTTDTVAILINTTFGPHRILGDFNGDGNPDLVWQNDSTRQVTVNYYGGAQGAVFQGWNWLNSGGIPGWKVVGAADFNGDGVPDLIWQNDATRKVVVHYYAGAQGAVFQGWNWLNSAGIPGWTVVGAADFNGDGVPDLIWQNDATRKVTVHYYGGAQGAVFQGWAWLNSAGIPGWKVGGAADFNGDGVPDLIWQNDATRKVTVQFYGGALGAVFQGWAWLNSAGIPGWTAVGANDFDKNGTPDLVWQNDTTRQVTVHFYNGPNPVFTGWAWLNKAGIPGWRAIVPR